VHFEAIALMLILSLAIAAQADEDPLAKYAEPEEPELPPSNMVLDLPRTAIAITDPQIDFLSPDGVTWGLVGNSVTANETVEHIEQLLKSAKDNDIAVFISPTITTQLITVGNLKVRWRK
jgi:isochorismate hydrolase